MDQPGDVVELLREIRDLHRDHLAESKRVSQEALELNRVAIEASEEQFRRSKEQYQRSIDASRGFTWALCIFIALSFVTNLLILARLSGSR